jgi:hypothetical protein
MPRESNWTSNDVRAVIPQAPGLFGSIAKDPIKSTPVDFIPWDADSNIVNIKEEAIWKGLSTKEMQYWAYCFCSPLASVIDRLADADINGDLMFLRKSDDSDSNSQPIRKIKHLLTDPNPLEDQYEFRAAQVTYKRTYGYALIYGMGMSNNNPSTSSFLWNLNPYFCEPIRDDNFNPFDEEKANPIKYWNVRILGKDYTIPADKVLILKDSYLPRHRDELGLPISKISGLDWAISNICAAMEADNVLLRKKGPLGFISQDSTKDPVAGYVPLSPKEKAEVQDDLHQYGLTWAQWQYVVTRHGLKWNPMSFNVKDLDTKGTIREGIDMIADRYGYPAELMSGKNATYENRTSAERYLYNSTVIPSNRRDMYSFSKWFGLLEDYIYYDYTDYPAIRDTKVTQGEGIKMLSEGLIMQFQANIIHLNQVRQILEQNTVPGEDIYYSSKEYQEKYGKNTPSQGAGNEKALGNNNENTPNSGGNDSKA